MLRQFRVMARWTGGDDFIALFAPSPRAALRRFRELYTRADRDQLESAWLEEWHQSSSQSDPELRGTWKPADLLMLEQPEPDEP